MSFNVDMEFIKIFQYCITVHSIPLEKQIKHKQLLEILTANFQISILKSTNAWYMV